MMIQQDDVQLLAGAIRVVIFMALFIPAWVNGAAGNENTASGGGNKGAKTPEEALWYVTVRNRIAPGGGGEFYGGERGEMRTGLCRLDFVPIPALKEIAAAAPFYVPDDRKELKGVAELDMGRFWSDVCAFVERDHGSLLFYVHGFNVGFEKGCRQAAIFQRALGQNHRLVFFSWPADGQFLKYTHDEADAAWSAPRMADALLKAVQCAGGDKLDVVAHSLGARVTVMALLSISLSRPPSAGPLINDLVLLAPDIDTETFRDIWPKLRQLVKKTTLYASANDKALRLSREIHGYPRLGEAGEQLTLVPDIETIDISLTGKRRFSGHLYHLHNPSVVADLSTLLLTGQPADQRGNLQAATINGRRYWQLIPKAS